MKKAVLIPAYKPEVTFENFIKELANTDFEIVVVDDGSGSEFDEAFYSVSEYCRLVRYPENHGKGYALKTGYKYIRENMPDCECIVTADADGQHKIPDIFKVAERLEREESGFVIGAREFENDVPARSKFGNKLTRAVFRVLTGVKLTDTQTGLRAFRMSDLEWMEGIKGDRYEYEMNVLMEAAESKIKIHEESILTVYENNNSSSHFRAVRDGLRIYKTIYLASTRLKYLTSSVIAFWLNYALILLLSNSPAVNNVISGLVEKMPEGLASLFHNAVNVAFATFIAWLISSFLNFILNRSFVFRKKDAFWASLLGYYSLAIISYFIKMLAEQACVAIFGNHLAIIVPIVEAVFFILNYFIQHRFIFAKTKKKKNSPKKQKETDGSDR